MTDFERWDVIAWLSWLRVSEGAYLKTARHDFKGPVPLDKEEQI